MHYHGYIKSPHGCPIGHAGLAVTLHLHLQWSLFTYHFSHLHPWPTVNLEIPCKCFHSILHSFSLEISYVSSGYRVSIPDTATNPRHIVFQHWNSSIFYFSDLSCILVENVVSCITKATQKWANRQSSEGNSKLSTIHSISWFWVVEWLLQN